MEIRNKNSFGMFSSLLAFICLNLPLHFSIVQANHSYDDVGKRLQRRGYDIEGKNRDIHRNVALLDIVFVNGKKRICTGAIISCHMVITAGHCFFGPKSTPQEFAEPELTNSFIIIGTKKKFDSGYEQYLPIERILTHPNIKPWSCDLALVHTFTSMTVDKIGAIISLAQESAYSSIEPNVTILSWGRTLLPDEVSLEDNLEMEENSQEKVEAAEGEPHLSENEPNDFPELPNVDTSPDDVTTSSTVNTEETKSYIIIRGRDARQIKCQKKLTGAAGEILDRTIQVSTKCLESKDTRNQNADIQSDYSEKEIDHKYKSKALKRGSKTKRIRKTFISDYYRRGNGNKVGNRLAVENFQIINALACKKTIEKLMARYELHININEIICYESDEQYVTDEDSGAPVVRNGQIIATTVGGIDIDGEHIALGMKLSYFCSWIAENLPSGDVALHCKEEPRTTEETTIEDPNRLQTREDES